MIILSGSLQHFPEYTAWRMEVPSMFGTFHIAAVLIAVIIAAAGAYYAKRLSVSGRIRFLWCEILCRRACLHFPGSLYFHRGRCRSHHSGGLSPLLCYSHAARIYLARDPSYDQPYHTALTHGRSLAARFCACDRALSCDVRCCGMHQHRSRATYGCLLCRGAHPPQLRSDVLPESLSPVTAATGRYNTEKRRDPSRAGALCDFYYCCKRSSVPAVQASCVRTGCITQLTTSPQDTRCRAVCTEARPLLSQGICIPAHRICCRCCHRCTGILLL